MEPEDQNGDERHLFSSTSFTSSSINFNDNSLTTIKSSCATDDKKYHNLLGRHNTDNNNNNNNNNDDLLLHRFNDSTSTTNMTNEMIFLPKKHNLCGIYNNNQNNNNNTDTDNSNNFYHLYPTSSCLYNNNNNRHHRLSSNPLPSSSSSSSSLSTSKSSLYPIHRGSSSLLLPLAVSSTSLSIIPLLFMSLLIINHQLLYYQVHCLDSGGGRLGKGGGGERRSSSDGNLTSSHYNKRYFMLNDENNFVLTSSPESSSFSVSPSSSPNLPPPANEPQHKQKERNRQISYHQPNPMVTKQEDKPTTVPFVDDHPRRYYQRNSNQNNNNDQHGRQQHPLLSIVNFSSTGSSPSIHSNANELFPSTSSWGTRSSSTTSTNHLSHQPKEFSSSSLDRHHLPGHHYQHRHHGPINLARMVVSNENADSPSSSTSHPLSEDMKFSHHRTKSVSNTNAGSGDVPGQENKNNINEDNNDGGKQKQSVDINKNDHSQSQRKPRQRDSKLGHEFINDLSTTPQPPSMISARPNSKDLSRSNQPSAGSGSGMDDLLGGLAQLLGGNLKLPNSNSGANAGGLPIPPFSSGGSEQQSTSKLANLLSQITGGNNLGLNQRIPPHLTHLIPRGPNGTPLLPSFLTPKVGPNPPSQHSRPNSNFPIGPLPPQTGPPPPPNYPPFPFIPLLSSGSAQRPATIPLNGNQPPMPIKPVQNMPLMHGLSKAEMDALFHQFVSNNGANKTNLISNLMSKLQDNKLEHHHHGHHMPIMNNNEIVPFNLNDTSRISPGPSLGTAGSTQEPQIITMQEAPSVFEMVVKHKMGPSASEPPASPVMIRPTSVSPSVIRPTTSMSTSTISSVIQSSMAGPDITEIRNHHTQVLKVTESNSKANKGTDVVYGKRITPSTTTTIMKSLTPTMEMVQPSLSLASSSLGKTYLQPGNIPPASSAPTIGSIIHQATSISPTPVSSTIQQSTTYGKPLVMPMPVENVKPKVSPYEPGRIDTTKYTAASNSKVINENIKPPLVKMNSPIAGASMQSSSISMSSNNNSIASSISGSIKKSQAKPYVRRPSFRPRPNVPIVRIDTCIVGDDSTCDMSLNEKCITELGLSSCQCRPGFARTIPRTNCVPVISLSVSFRIDKMAGNKVQFTRPLLNPNSEEYQYLEYESIHALNSIFAQTKSLNTDLMAVKINRFYAVGGRTVVNATISLRTNDTSVNSQRIKRQLQQELTQVIVDNNNNLGESQLSVDSSNNAISRIDDLNECSSPDYNDCSKNARCINEFGGFRCECEPGYEDKFPDDKFQSGRVCSTCSPQYCSNRGECLIVKGERVCRCRANFIGSQCDIDAEVLGVAIGGSIAALVIIVITFICLYMWNQRFRQEQQKIEAMSAASGHTFSYLNKPSAMAAATMSRMSMVDERYGGAGRSWTHYSDSQQHLLSSSSTTTQNGNAGGYYGNSNAAVTSNNGTDHQNASHVYAQPVRVVPSSHHHHGSSATTNDCYVDPTGGYHDVWGGSRTRNSLHCKKTSRSHDHHGGGHYHRSGTISGHGIHYPYKHDSYNETEFSTRELIYSPAHLYATNPRQSSHAYY